MTNKDINIISGLISRSKKEELAYDNPGHMMEYCFNIKLGTIHWEWCELVMEAYRDPLGPYNPLFILAPRDHAKTTVLTEGCTLWRIGSDPETVMGQIISVTSLKAGERLDFCKSVIRFNEKFRNLFGNLYPGKSDEFTWNNQGIQVLVDRTRLWQSKKEERDNTLSAYGIESNTEGGRTNWQVFDDIVGRENSRSDISRKEVATKYWITFEPMLVPLGVRLINGTRYAFDDIYGEFQVKYDTLGEYKHLRKDEEGLEIGIAT